MNRKHKNKKNQRKASRNRKGGGKTGLAELTDRDSYAGLEKDVIILPGSPVLLTTTVTTGVISSAITLDPVAGVGDWSTRVAPLWDEYRTLGVNMKIRPVGGSNVTGITVFMFNEKSNNAGTLLDSQQRMGLRFPNGANSLAMKTMRFRTSDLLDLQYTSTASSNAVAYFKTYTDATNYGSPTAATALWLIEPEYVVELRGIKAT